MSDPIKPGESESKSPSSFASQVTIDSVSSQATGDFTPVKHAPPQDAPPKSDTTPPSSGATIDLTPTAPAASQATGDFTPSSSGATADFSPQPRGNAETMGVESIGVEPAPAARPAPISGGKVIPKVPGYQILSELGRGGMGVVYKAKHKTLNRLVAIKMVLAGGHAGSEQIARFHIEAQAVAALQHRNIVQIHEVGECDGLPYFSLEFVDGGPLDKRLAGKPQPAIESARLMEKLSRAMFFAHQHGIVHRDLKPANVLMSADNEPKITDFGLAKNIDSDSSQTKSGTLMGTPSYMAPEQARGEFKELGPSADIHALGAMLYEMLVGRPPFLGSTPVETIMQVINQEPVPPSSLLPKLPRDIETITLKCLQKEPNKRYPDAESLAEDLRRFVAGEPILSRPVSAPERAWRWCKRNPRVAGLCAAVLVLLVTAGSALAISAGQAARNRETVQVARTEALKRLEQGTAEITGGNFSRARDLLSSTDPVVENAPQLADVRTKLHLLRDQVELYREYRELLDNARYYGLFGAQGGLQDAQGYCRRAVELYDAIEQKTGQGSCGMPPLNAAQHQLLQEAYFEAFLVSAQVEWESVAKSTDAEVRLAAAKKAVELLDRAEKVYPGTWVLHYRRATFLENAGDAKRAAADMEALAKLSPTSPLDRFWFALSQHMQGDALKEKDNTKAEQHYRRAIAEYSSVVRARPDHFWAYFDGAACHFQLGELSDAAIGFTVCIQVRPEVAWPYYNRGTILSQQKQFEPAIEDYSRALERNADFADAYSNRGLAQSGLGKTELAMADFEQALKTSLHPASVYLNRGETHLKANRLEEAFADFERAEKADDKNPLIFSVRGSALLARQEFAKAQSDFARLIALQPDKPENYRIHGVTSLRLQDFEAAHRDWVELARLMPKNPEPQQNMAITFKAQRKYDEAAKALTDAIAISPNDSKSYLYRAQVYHQQGKLNEALADLTIVLTKLRDVKGEILNDYGDLLRTSGKLPEALGVYQQSAKMLPKQTDAYVGQALVHQLLGKPEEGEQVLTQLIAVNPVWRAYLRRAEYRRSLGKWEEALQDLDEAAKLDPKSALPALVRASIRAARGEFREGVQEAEAMLKAVPSDGIVQYAAACVWSLASSAAEKSGDTELAKQHTDRAAAYLAETMEKGFLDPNMNFQAYNRMLVDPALAPIRQHPVVLELLPVLRPKAEAPAAPN